MKNLGESAILYLEKYFSTIDLGRHEKNISVLRSISRKKNPKKKNTHAKKED